MKPVKRAHLSLGLSPPNQKALDGQITLHLNGREAVELPACNQSALAPLTQRSPDALPISRSQLKALDQFIATGNLDEIINTFGNSDKAAVAVAYLISSCPGPEGSNDPGVLDKLMRMGAAAVPALRSALSDPDPDVRAISATLLGCLKHKALPAFNELWRLMTSKTSPPQTRLCALRALTKLPGGLETVTARLEQILGDPTEQEYFVATFTRLIGKNKAAPFNLYCLALKHPSVPVRLAAAEEVARLRSRAEPILAQLKASLGDEDSAVRLVVAAALSSMGTNGFLALKDTLLGSRNDQQRSTILQAIGQMGSKTTTPAKVFGEVLVSEVVDIQLTQAVAAALVQVGLPSVPYLKEALDHKDSRVVEFAARALGQLGASASEALPYMVVVEQRPGLSPLAKESLARAVVKLRQNIYNLPSTAALHPVHERFDVLQLLPNSSLTRGRP